MILGDNSTDANISNAVKNFEDGAVFFLEPVPDPERFGVVALDPDDPTRIVSIEEKPRHAKSHYAVRGLYLYDNRVFDFIRQCDPNYAGRGELEITQVNNFYLRAGKLRWEALEGFWSDAGTVESLFNASKYWAEKASASA